MTLEDGDLTGLHDGGAQVATTALGHPTTADLVAAVELLDVLAKRLVERWIG